MTPSTSFRVIALAAAATCLAAGRADALLHDHLECYKVKDSASFSATVDMRPLDSMPFVVDAGCTVKVRSRQVCFPVIKQIVTSTAPHRDISGQDLANALICYQVKCPSATPPQTLEMSDQFGTHTLTGFRVSTLCAPAILGAPPETTTTTTMVGSGEPRNCVDATPPDCDGTCNNFNFGCMPDGLGSCYCASTDAFGNCGSLGGPPVCYGSCEGSLSCLDVSGTCQCGLAFE